MKNKPLKFLFLVKKKKLKSENISFINIDYINILILYSSVIFRAEIIIGTFLTKKKEKILIIIKKCL